MLKILLHFALSGNILAILLIQLYMRASGANSKHRYMVYAPLLHCSTCSTSRGGGLQGESLCFADALDADDFTAHQIQELVPDHV
jgi:hypothetical protein